MGYNETDFFYQDGIFKLVINDVTFDDGDEKRQYNTGTTIAVTDSEDILKSPAYDIKNDEILYSDLAFNRLETINDKPHTFDTIIDTDNDFNIHKYRTAINRNDFILGVMKSGSFNPDFIYPGMPFKYIFEKDDIIKETTGIVQSLEYYYDIPNNTIVVSIIGLFKKIKETV
jgi:hypothetical protein